MPNVEKNRPLEGLGSALKDKETRKTLATFAQAIIYEATGLKKQGNKLIEKLGSENEDVVQLAAMSLVHKQRKSEPLLKKALHEEGKNLPMVILVLSSTENAANYKDDFTRLSQSKNEQVAEAATWAIKGIEDRKNPI